MPTNLVRRFELYVQDLPRAKNFCESVLKLKQMKFHGTESRSVFFREDLMRCGGALVNIETFSSGGSHIPVDFDSDDCHVEATRVTWFGARIEAGKALIGEYGFIVLANDPEGNLLGLHSMN